MRPEQSTYLPDLNKLAAVCLMRAFKVQQSVFNYFAF